MPYIRELERRQRADRRAPLDTYIQSILNARSGRDRRSDQQLIKDNAFVNQWMQRFHQLRS